MFFLAILLEQLLCTDTEGLCTANFFHADRRLYTLLAFTERCLTCTHKFFLHTDALHKKDSFHAKKTARRRSYTQNITEPCTQRSLCTEQFLHKETFTQKDFGPQKLAHRLHKDMLLDAETLPRAAFYTEKLVRTEAAQKSTHSSCRQTVCTYRIILTQKSYAQKLLRTTVFTHKRFYTYTQMPLHTQKNFYTQKLVHTARFYTQPAFTQRGFASPS